ncbi:molecular chaperone [Rahnella aquatilis]|nr:molecular chaperone [Rahnella aquatilis]
MTEFWMNTMIKTLAGICLVLFTAQAYADGGVSFSRNRMIFPASEKSISITVNNHSDNTYLVQAGVSLDSDKKTPAPFMVTPPLFRLEKSDSNVMRIMRVGGDMPPDRESVFYFFASTIPSQSVPTMVPGKDGTTGARVTIAMKTVLKLFWRPEGLSMSPASALSKLGFVNEPGGVVVKNPTPYYQSFAALTFDGKAQDIDRQPSMVSPFSELRFTTPQPVRQVSWAVMNDYGGATEMKTQATENQKK